jgi:kinesin family member 2/24
LPLVLSGGIACILAYGQTGSGKTFTMEGLEMRVARDLFSFAEEYGKNLLAKEQGSEDVHPSPGSVYEFSVTFLELLGRRATDLVGEGKEDTSGNIVRPEVAILEDKV